MGLDVCSSAVRDVQGTLGASIQMKYKENDEQLTNKGDLPPRDCFSLSGLPLPTSYLTDLLFFILFLFIVNLLYSLSVLPLSVNSPLCLSLSLLVSLSLCSLVLFAQTETLSAELKHHSQS